jgi:hypothetical protein
MQALLVLYMVKSPGGTRCCASKDMLVTIGIADPASAVAGGVDPGRSRPSHPRTQPASTRPATT